LREQRIENIGDPNYKEPPSYDQYQRERKETLSDPEITQMTKKWKIGDQKRQYCCHLHLRPNKISQPVS
jgi:hypothetical protein